MESSLDYSWLHGDLFAATPGVSAAWITFQRPHHYALPGTELGTAQRLWIHLRDTSSGTLWLRPLGYDVVDSFLLASVPIFSDLVEAIGWLYVKIHISTGLSWAWSIIALTVLVRVIIMPVTIKGTTSMLTMQRLQPYVKQLQQKYKNDRTEMNAQMMQFYRDNKFNPLSSCFPMLLQLPVFLALYQVLRNAPEMAQSVELFGNRIVRKSGETPLKLPDPGDFSFLFGFVNDITHIIKNAGLPGLIILLVYAASQLLSGKVMVTSPDPRQRMMMMFLPLAFIPFLYNSFQVGLALYWLTSNLWTVGQHLVVIRLVDHDKPVILPENSKGKKKVINPKPSGGGTDDSSPAKPVNVRRNKRRR